MYENGIDVVYEVRYVTDAFTSKWGEHRKVTLPGWCAGDVHMALSLYLFGNRDGVIDVRVVDWQPVDSYGCSPLDDDDPPCGAAVPGTTLTCGWPQGHGGSHQRPPHTPALDHLTEVAKRMGLA